MLFSVVIPAYNAEGTISRTITSVLNQSLSDYEIIVVDDGSNDSTPELVGDMASRFDALRLIRQPNLGPLIARRTGAAASSGEYILFLDADDCFLPEALAVLKREIVKSQADIISFPCDQRGRGQTEIHALLPGAYVGEEYASVKRVALEGTFNPLWSKAFRRDVLDFGVDYSECSHMRYAEDWFQLLRWIDASESLIQLETPLYRYEENPHSAMSMFRKEYIGALASTFSEARHYANKWGRAEFDSAYERGIRNQTFNLLLLMIGSVRSRDDQIRELKRVRSLLPLSDCYKGSARGIDRYHGKVLDMIYDEHYRASRLALSIHARLKRRMSSIGGEKPA